MADMDDVRRATEIDAVSRVRVTFVENYFTGQHTATFMCVSCECEIFINPAKQWLQCPQCTYEVTFPETRELLMTHMRLLDGLARHVGIDLLGDVFVALAKEKGIDLLTRVRGIVNKARGSNGKR